jgi:hypothetical protein
MTIGGFYAVRSLPSCVVRMKISRYRIKFSNFRKAPVMVLNKYLVSNFVQR